MNSLARLVGLALLVGGGVVVFLGKTGPSDPMPAFESQLSATARSALARILEEPLTGTDADRRIARLIVRLGAPIDPLSELEKLGWEFLRRTDGEPTERDLRLALRCVEVMEDLTPETPGALLLRGRILHGCHRFEEAEALARRLVAIRGRSFDHGLLGDALLDQARYPEAAEAYQAMVDERPDARAFARIGRLRFLVGDREGARMAFERAVRSSSPRDREIHTWAREQLSLVPASEG